MLSILRSLCNLQEKSLSVREMINLSNENLRKIGIGNYGDLEETGEAHLLRYLSVKLSNKKSVIFDVGANIGPTGQYSQLFRQYFPGARIYAFEPNPSAYDDLCNATVSDKNQLNEKLALGDKVGMTTHFADQSLDKSELAGSNEIIFSEIFKFRQKPIKYQVKVDKIDSYCRKRKISKINFLKVDVEGSEYAVLSGAKYMLQNKKIDYIQFEFNIHNIYSRIFVKDFYNLLKGYYLYRLLPNGLLALGEYSTEYEVFRYQNILASKAMLVL